ncbi:MAG: hypothetical protein MRY83_10495 [Flavobacteriales bacterium]|nr:hypothetical protein [Flavobacteriales bacterium]
MISERSHTSKYLLATLMIGALVDLMIQKQIYPSSMMSTAFMVFIISLFVGLILRFMLPIFRKEKEAELLDEAIINPPKKKDINFGKLTFYSALIVSSVLFLSNLQLNI